MVQKIDTETLRGETGGPPAGVPSCVFFSILILPSFAFLTFLLELSKLGMPRTRQPIFQVLNISYEDVCPIRCL